MFEVLLSRTAEKQLGRLDRTTRSRILPALISLRNDPQPSGCRKIKSEHNVWRIRVGDYRIGYLIDPAEKRIEVLRIVHRSEFYG